MENPRPQLWEDGEYVYISEELFEHLPPEYREYAEKTKRLGKDVLKMADADLQNLVRLSKAIPTSMSLSYIYHRLRTAKFDLTMEDCLEQEMLTTAFIVTYSRLFISGNGVKGISRDIIPAHLKKVHDEIIDIRHKRYAHNGGHETVGSGLEIFYAESKFNLSMQLSFGFFKGGRDEWKELITIVDAHMHEMLYKILARLKEKTGYEWTTSTGPTPDWISSQ